MNNKIYVMCFYESNVRYFHYAELSLGNPKFIYLCMYSSAVKYCKKNGLDFIYLPHHVRLLNEYDNITDIELEEITSFHNKLFPGNEKKFFSLARKYLSFYESISSINNTSCVVIGDVRLFSSTAKYISKVSGLNVFYFEPGPFGTMIFDKIGVNKNMEIANDSLNKMKNLVDHETDYLDEFYSSKREVKYFENDLFAYLRKIPDVLYSVPPKCLSKYLYPEIQTGETLVDSIPYLLGRIFSSKKKHDKKNISMYGNFIVFPLQVPCDVQIIMNSPYFRTIQEMIFSVYESLPDGYNLVIREHPMNKGRYDKDIYKFIDKNSNIYLDNDNDLWELVERSKLVVVNNSTVGIEALKYDTEVLVLGETYYHQVVHVYKGGDLSKAIGEAIDNYISRNDKNAYLSYIYSYFLIKDNYKNKEYYNLDKMLARINND